MDTALSFLLSVFPCEYSAYLLYVHYYSSFFHVNISSFVVSYQNFSHNCVLVLYSEGDRVYRAGQKQSLSRWHWKDCTNISAVLL